MNDAPSFEATMENGDSFKKLVAAVGDMITNANFVCDEVCSYLFAAGSVL